MGVGEVDPGAAHLHEELAGMGHRIGQHGRLQDLGTAEAEHLDRSHTTDPSPAGTGGGCARTGR